MLTVAPIVLDDARRWIHQHHSHLDPPMRVIMATSIEDNGRRCCVAVAEWPKARAFNGRAAEISRVASDGTKHAASKAIAALSRGLIAVGWRRLVSSTLLGEAGTSYRAAGWWPVNIGEPHEQWTRGCRPRGDAQQPGAKVRWEFGPDAMRIGKQEDRDALDAAILAAVGTVELPGRTQRNGPLFSKRGRAAG